MNVCVASEGELQQSAGCIAGPQSWTPLMQHAISGFAALTSSGMQLANADADTLKTRTAAVTKRESGDTDPILWRALDIVKPAQSDRSLRD